MKTVQSAGGPLIGINRTYAALWRGVFGSGFVGQADRYVNDYEATELLTVTIPPSTIAKLGNTNTEVFFISMPLETAVINDDPCCTYIAQIEYADRNWSFNKINTLTFQNAIFDEEIEILSEGGVFLLQDAAYAGDHSGDDNLELNLLSGRYKLSSKIFKPDASTMLIIYRLLFSGRAKGP